ncbi:DNA primase [Paenibacillus spiritus]|uniref:DNA primase n=1 Tax=Paenibacillus spiritus TaxID=2496557 RepID=A0A5J5GHE0_9BACL|nr:MULTISPECIES: DNA primase [Paenibacillus]KAA9007639.1 DNA primase [Paenibacillus spiritus]
MASGHGSIPEEVIESVLARHDIVETVGKVVHLTKRGKYLWGLCPFHSESTPSFTVTPDRGVFHCFGCGMGGNAIKFRMEIEGLSFPEAVRIMADESDIAVPDGPSGGHAAPDPERDRLLQAYDLSAKFYHFLLKNTEYGKEAMAYLRSRNFSDKMIDQFQIGFAPDRWDTLQQFLEKRSFDLAEMERGGLLSARSEGRGYVDRFRGRIIFPIANRTGKTVAFAARILGEGQPKYLNSPESRLFNKSRLLYNLHQARASIRKTRQIVLFEGYGDVISAWEAGVHNGVATMGTSLTEGHAALMKTLADEVVVAYDGDKAGQAAAMKSIPMLENVGLRVKIAVLPSGLDPDEFIGRYGGERFMDQVIHAAVSTVKFKLIYLKKGHILLEEDGKIAYVKEALEIIAALPSSTEREVYLKEIATELNLSYESLKQDCNLLRASLQKNIPEGDNNDKRWNNGRHKKEQVQKRALLPAYHAAERSLLAVMFQDADAAAYVNERLGDAFNIEDHAALAAYLYAYYAQGKQPDLSRFLSSLQDDKLEKTAASIAMMESPPAWNPQVLDDCIREVRKYPVQRQMEQKREEMIRAERAGDFLRAAQIASEIIALERQ